MTENEAKELLDELVRAGAAAQAKGAQGWERYSYRLTREYALRQFSLRRAVRGGEGR